MPISPLTQMSLLASVNLLRLRKALEHLKESHGFYCDDGTWCCRNCAVGDAWEYGEGKPYVLWHEQNENDLYEYPGFEMDIYFGITSNLAKNEDIASVAKKIISVLEDYDIPTIWNGDIQNSIKVELDNHKPMKGEDPDEQNVCLYIPDNEDTEEYLQNPSEMEDEPLDSWNFYQEIKDGESLLDAVMRIEPNVRKHITHYQRHISSDSTLYPTEPILEIDQDCGHSGYESLKESIENFNK